ncbi:hypothetical protein PIB19_02675 [Sphingomonas sp. 7/4-4]|nr:hypothetical protein [Sphingomonas sp. 7/4-4]WBY08433.1 hypothetical protein PIB19_02675 [Sphingomonas sp. 7/4-4]
MRHLFLLSAASLALALPAAARTPNPDNSPASPATPADAAPDGQDKG